MTVRSRIYSHLLLSSLCPFSTSMPLSGWFRTRATSLLGKIGTRRTPRSARKISPRESISTGTSIINLEPSGLQPILVARSTGAKNHSPKSNPKQWGMCSSIFQWGPMWISTVSAIFGFTLTHLRLQLRKLNQTNCIQCMNKYSPNSGILMLAMPTVMKVLNTLQMESILIGL